MLAVPRRRVMFTGVVLAGGRSSRMGRDKARLIVEGRTLLDRAIDLLRAAGATAVLVSGDRPEHHGIVDRVPGAGPVGGIASVLSHVADDAIVALPVDLPALDVESVRQLVSALARHPAVSFEGHPLPWAAKVDVSLRSTVDRLLLERPQGPSMRALHRTVGGVEIQSATPAALRNVNTPADLEDFAP